MRKSIGSYSRVLVVLGFLAGVLNATSAVALNSISLAPPSVVADIGDSISFDLIMDFSAELQGGGVEITYDPSLLAFQSFVFDPLLPDDVPFRCWPHAVTPHCNDALPPTIEVGWGVLFSPALTGSHVIGTFLFQALISGPTGISLAPSVGFPGPFFDTNGNPIPTEFQGASVAIGLVAIPEPTASLLFGMGLCILSVRKRKSNMA